MTEWQCPCDECIGAAEDPRVRFDPYEEKPVDLLDDSEPEQKQDTDDGGQQT